MSNRLDIVTKRNETIKLYNNPFLESLTHAHPFSLVCIYFPIIFYLSYHAMMLGFIRWLGLFVLGIFFWTLLEYYVHRILFHRDPGNSRIKQFFYSIHEIHHNYPQDQTRLVIPTPLSIPFVVTFYFLFRFLLGNYSDSFFCGTLFGYLLYDLGHYAMHRYNSKNRFLRYCKRHHFTHHFYDNKKNFGVSSPLWDYFLRSKIIRPVISSKKV
jgi:sterol desaturase/sphingolipid hydroxylase (fatty acid hydroxylase superfamily)